MAASAVQAAGGESLWPVMLGTKWQRHFHATVASPVSAGDLYGGFVLWIAVRAALSMAAFLLIAALLGGVPSVWGIVAVPASVLGAMAFSAPLTAFAATQDNDVPFALIMRLGILPLFLFSGTFFPVNQLPGWLQPLALLSPLYHAVELCRSATTGRAAWADLAHIAVLLGCVAAGAWWGSRTFTRKLAS
jgi:lipooligosaccharide transport system permease protein